MTPTLNYLDWINLAYEKFALRISDIANLNPSDKLDLLILDRNVWDTTLQPKFNEPNISHSPTDFFRENFGTYIRNYDLSGQLILHQSDPFVMNFEFDIEYKDHYWYPLFDGYLPESDAQGIYGNFGFGKDMHWTEFDPTTRIGYRGPMILKSNLEMMPKIYWELISPTGTRSDADFSFSSVSTNETDSDDVSTTIFDLGSDVESDTKSDSVDEINPNQINIESDSESDTNIRFSFESDNSDNADID